MSKPRHTFGGSSDCSATAEHVWAVWTDPGSWPGDLIAQAKIDGPFAVGAKITVRVKGYPPLTSTVTSVDPLKSWTGVAKAPGLTQTIDHVIETTDTGTRLTERTTFTGPFAAVAALVLGRGLRKSFEGTTAYCARLAEERAAL